jgi:uncharacterized protein (TIGR01777 family)
MANILVAGGSGFVGRYLIDAMVKRGDAVTLVSRDPARAQVKGRKDVSYRGYVPAMDSFDAVVNLAGAPIFGKHWDREYKDEIRSSRIEVTDAIVEAIEAAVDKPGVLINASAIGYYGNRGPELLPETAAPGSGFMAEVCAAWEAAAARCPVRTVLMRIGVVLGPDGGALSQMLPPFKLGLGGPIGMGRHWFSWIHMSDLAGLILHAIDTPSLSGAVNATAPGVVTNLQFTKALGRVLSRPTLLPVPPIALRLMFGEVATLLTSSQRCVAEAAATSGYPFALPDIEPALHEVLGR